MNRGNGSDDESDSGDEAGILTPTSSDEEDDSNGDAFEEQLESLEEVETPEVEHDKEKDDGYNHTPGKPMEETCESEFKGDAEKDDNSNDASGSPIEKGKAREIKNLDEKDSNHDDAPGEPREKGKETDIKVGKEIGESSKGKKRKENDKDGKKDGAGKSSNSNLNGPLGNLNDLKAMLKRIVNKYMGGLDTAVSRKVLEAKLKLAHEAAMEYLKEKSEALKRFCKDHPWKSSAIVLLAVLGSCSGLLAAAALAQVGFTSGGVALGSIAAGWQSSIGAVAAGSVFATLQSIAATGAIVGIGYEVCVPIISSAIYGLAGGSPSDAFRSIRAIGSKVTSAATTAVNTVAVGGMVVAAVAYHKFRRWWGG